MAHRVPPGKQNKMLDATKGQWHTYHTMSKGERTMTETLKRAIAQSDLPLQRIEKATGVKRGSIMRFTAGKQSLRLDMADKLAAYFGIECRQRRRRGRTR